MQGGGTNEMRDAGRSEQGRAPVGAEQSGDGRLDAMIPMYESGRARKGKGRSWFGSRGPALWYGGLALVGVVLVGVMILLTLPPPARQTARQVLPLPSATAQATATADAPPLPTFNLPAFSDWRVAYLTPDGTVHVSALDGTSDLTGPVLALNTEDTTNGTGAWVAADSSGAAYTSIAVAPNGRYLAYINAAPPPDGAGIAPPSGPLAFINLAPDGRSRDGWSATSFAGTVTHLAGWSPDSTRLAMEATVNGIHGIYFVGPTDGAPTLISTTNDNGPLAQSHVIGWLDNTHVLLMTTGAGTALPPVSAQGTPSAGDSASVAALTTGLTAPLSSNGDRSLATVDITTGEAFEITRVPGSAVVALSPDGKEIEAYSGCQAGCEALAPEIVDTATGQTHALPNSADALALQGIALWQPGGSNLAVTIVGQGPPPEWRVNLVDTQSDSARTLVQTAYTIAWSPDGQHLVLGDSGGLGPLGAQLKVTVMSPTDGSTTALPQLMSAFIGFVKTA